MGRRSISPSLAVGVAVEQVVAARGLKRDCQSVALDGAIDDAGSLQIFGEEVIPGVHLFRVNEQNGARHIAGLAKILFSALPDIHDRNVTTGCKGWSPGDRNGTQREWLGRDHGHFGCAFRPTGLDGKVFGVHAVRACVLEGRETPFDSLPHGWRARNATANLVSQPLQVGF